MRTCFPSGTVSRETVYISDIAQQGVAPEVLREYITVIERYCLMIQYTS